MVVIDWQSNHSDNCPNTLELPHLFLLKTSLTFYNFAEISVARLNEIYNCNLTGIICRKQIT